MGSIVFKFQNLGSLNSLESTQTKYLENYFIIPFDAWLVC